MIQCSNRLIIFGVRIVYILKISTRQEYKSALPGRVLSPSGCAENTREGLLPGLKQLRPAIHSRNCRPIAVDCRAYPFLYFNTSYSLFKTLEGFERATWRYARRSLDAVAITIHSYRQFSPGYRRTCAILA